MTVLPLTSPLTALAAQLPALAPRPEHGRLLRAVGTVLWALLPGARIGELCRVEERGAPPLLAEVIGLDGDTAVLAPIGDMRGLSQRAAVIPTGDVLRVPVGAAVLGRVLDGMGRPLDLAAQGPLPHGTPTRPVDMAAPDPLDRALVEKALPLGVRAVDGMLTCGEGQRLGIYGEPGSGKSSLLAQLVRGAQVDAVVIGLIGERGREVRDFIDRQLDPAARARTVLVVATSDRPAVERLKAAYAATTIAEAFRDAGQRVLLVIDSITRFARALREIGLAAGEPPTRRGFPPSVMAELPRLLERAGPGATGSITAFYSVLVEGDGTGDPVAEETRGILDGHIVLSPKLAATGHFPAIDVLASRSRVMDAIVPQAHRDAARHLRGLLQRHDEIEFLVQVGEYQAGADPAGDEALAKIAAVRAFLRQESSSHTAFAQTQSELSRLCG